MIPKIIHYCWFGGNAMPEDVVKCIDSWKKFAPDFELKLWDESNYDLDKYDYVKEAFEANKWAFVTDVVRLDVVHQFGGIYLDTDVELIKPIDHLLELKAFMAFEQPGRVNTGLGFGAEAGNSVIKANLLAYTNRHFIVNGKMDTTTCVTTTVNVLNALTGSTVTLEGISNTLYLSDYEFTILAQHIMCPYDLETGKTTLLEDTISIHHYDATWKSHKDYLLRVKMKLRRLMGSERYERLKALIK